MKLMIFSGTTEGHDLCRFLSKNSVQADIFVATEYGAAVMEPMAGITVHEGRLDEQEMEKRLTSDTLLIDATHPYAAAVTDNLRAACAKSGARYERLLRPALPYQNCEIVLDTAAAVDWLNAHPGKVLLTTGSKELEAYTAVQDFQTRLFPRVLPTASVLEKCAALGFPGAHIIAMQGPFSQAMNAALLRETGAKILVTKDTGVSGGFAEMDTDTCVVYSFGGAKLNSVQSGYARPALAAGKSRFVLYNRSGNELRVESRTQNLYTKTLDSSIYLCAVADAGQVAVATDDTDSVAKLTVYSSAMEQVLSWNLTSAEGTPLRMAFSPDSRRIAVAAVTANGGQLTTNLYVLALAQGDPVQLGTATSVPQWLGWLSGDSVLALYEDRAVLYGANGGEKASYDFGGSTLVDVDTENGGVALLLSGGQTCTAVLLDNSLGVQYSGNVPAASHILRAADGFYLLTDSTVECFNKAGEFQWTQPMDAKPQAGVLNGRQLLVFSGNTVQQVTAPEPDSSSAS